MSKINKRGCHSKGVGRTDGREHACAHAPLGPAAKLNRSSLHKTWARPLLKLSNCPRRRLRRLRVFASTAVQPASTRATVPWSLSRSLPSTHWGLPRSLAALSFLPFRADRYTTPHTSHAIGERAHTHPLASSPLLSPLRTPAPLEGGVTRSVSYDHRLHNAKPQPAHARGHHAARWHALGISTAAEDTAMERCTLRDATAVARRGNGRVGELRGGSSQHRLPRPNRGRRVPHRSCDA